MWSRSQSDRFIESLLLGFPVPGIFLVQGAGDIYLVLDGQQRLLTLRGFYRGVLHEKAFRLQSVQPDFQGLTYETLDPEIRRRLDNSIIHATIVKQEIPSNDQSGIYKVFERLNTGGTLLQPQEIRVALYNGRLIQLLRDLNTNASWRELCGPKSKRLTDQELILRFFAFLAKGDSYSAPMKEFLNDYTSWNRDLKKQSGSKLTVIFESTVDVIRKSFGRSAFRPSRAVNAAVVDSAMTVVSEGITTNSLRKGASLKKAYARLLVDTEYEQAVERATAREEQVALRLARARHYLLS